MTVYFERMLPQWQEAGKTLFLTYRLLGSIDPLQMSQIYRNLNFPGYSYPTQLPEAELQRARKLFFKYFDEVLDQNEHGPSCLQQPEIIKIIGDALRYCEDIGYWELHCFCIMPNHVHVLCTHLTDSVLPMHAILRNHKGFITRECNRVLGKTGSLLNAKIFDHEVQDAAEFERIQAFILNNPAKVGLVQPGEVWPGLYVAQERKTAAG